jgi:outer membrane lipoprotein-sorting protein
LEWSEAMKAMARLKIRCALTASWVLALGMIGATASAQTPDSQRARTQDLNAILAAWARSSAQIKSVSAQFSRTGRGLGWGTIEYRYTLKWRKSGQAVLDVVEVKRKNKTEPVYGFLWTGKEVWFYHTYKKEIEVMQPSEVQGYAEFRDWMKTMPFPRALLGSRFDLIFPALRDPKEFDPLPFLIGFDDVAARKRFQFELVESKDPKRLVIRATPLAPMLQMSYSSVLITLHSERFLPVSLEYHTGRGGREILRYTFLEVSIDPDLADNLFEPRKPAGWKIQSPSD